jgi:hypothetical protein
MNGPIKIKCPNCGALTELPPHLDTGFCVHCGKMVKISKGEPSTREEDLQNPSISCSACSGYGYFYCSTCRSSGACSGVVTRHADGNYYTHSCRMGACPMCEGSGSDMLVFNCSHCRGTGKCPTCRGYGRCIQCGGQGRLVCQVCNGSGVVPNK